MSESSYLLKFASLAVHDAVDQEPSGIGIGVLLLLLVLLLVVGRHLDDFGLGEIRSQ